MNLPLKALIALFGLAMLGVGAAFVLAPLRVGADFAVGIVSLAGLGTLRADLGGLFLVMGGFALAGLRAGHADRLGVPLVMLLVILALRLFHLGTDGVTDAGLRSTVVEAIGVVLLWAGRRRLAAPC